MGASVEEAVQSEAESGEQLAARAQAGCLLSYERLVRLYQDRLFTFLHQIVGNAHDAEDLAQETFVKAYTHLARFDGRARFSTWLYAIAKNTALNHLRRRRVHEPVENIEQMAASPPAGLDDGEKKSIWDVARTLKQSQFETLWLFYGEGFSLKEVAEILGNHPITVRVNLHRARSALGKKLRRNQPLLEALKQSD